VLSVRALGWSQPFDFAAGYRLKFELPAFAGLGD
jgi:hypothetical protein